MDNIIQPWIKNQNIIGWKQLDLINSAINIL